MPLRLYYPVSRKVLPSQKVASAVLKEAFKFEYISSAYVDTCHRNPSFAFGILSPDAVSDMIGLSGTYDLAALNLDAAPDVLWTEEQSP